MPLHHKPITPPDNSTTCESDRLNLSAAAFSARVQRCHEFDRAEKVTHKVVDEVGPHIEFLKAFGGVADSYQPVVANEPQCPHEKRLKFLMGQAHHRIDSRGLDGNLPKGARVIDITDVLASQRNAQPIRGFKAFLDKAGIEPGKTSYLKFPDGTFSAVRRRILDNTAAADEVVWVETFAAVGHLHNLNFTERGAQLRLPILYDVKGFFDPDDRVAVMQMIDKRNGRSLSEWRDESLVVLQTAVHELEHGKGGAEYQARAAGDAYLHRTGIMPNAGDPRRRLESISLGWYSAHEYATAVGDTMRDLKVSTMIVPARLPDSRVEVIPVPIHATFSVGAFTSDEAMRRGDPAEVFSYGLIAERIDRTHERTVWFRLEDAELCYCDAVGGPLSDRILQETLRPDQNSLRIVVSGAISHRVAHESLRMAELLQAETPNCEIMLGLSKKIATSFDQGDVHLAVRDYVRRQGGAAVIHHGKESAWLNCLPEGITLRTADSVTIFFASPIHRGAALRIPLKDGDSYLRIAEQARHFERDISGVEKLFERRKGESLWESIAVPHIAKGARYLFPAMELNEER